MKIHPRVSLSMVSHWNWPVERDLAFCEREGIQTVGLSLAKLEAAGGWRRHVAAIRERGFRVTNLLGVDSFPLFDRTTWAARREGLLDALDAAAAHGAEQVILTSGPARDLCWEEAADACAEALAPIVEAATTRGLSLALENTHALRVDIGFVHTLRDAIDLARQIGSGVCMEINACWAEQGLAQTIAAGSEVISIVQLSDFAIGTRCTPDRLVPGDGDIPLARIVGQLLAAGYGGVFDIEMVGPRIDAEGYESASPRALQHVSVLLERVASA